MSFYLRRLSVKTAPPGGNCNGWLLSRECWVLLVNGPIWTKLFVMTAVSKIYFIWDCELILRHIKILQHFFCVVYWVWNNLLSSSFRFNGLHENGLGIVKTSINNVDSQTPYRAHKSTPTPIGKFKSASQEAPKM